MSGKRSTTEAASSPDTIIELHDVFLNIIGPMLNIKDLIELARVNRWGRKLAHQIKFQVALKVPLNYDATVELGLHQSWSNLEINLRLECDQWKQRTLFEGTVLCPASLKLWKCDIQDFEFVDGHKLDKLDVHDPDTKLGPVACASLERCLLSCPPRFLSLTLSWCFDENLDVKWLVNALDHFPQLTFLNLRSNHLGPEKMQLLSPTLAKMTGLETLMLGYNYMGVPGTRALATALCRMPQMKWLNMEANDLCVEGTKCLVPSLKQMPLLTNLYLWENWMGPEGVRCLLPLLPQMAHLVCLHLWDNDLDDNFKTHLRNLLPHVKELDI